MDLAKLPLLWIYFIAIDLVIGPYSPKNPTRSRDFSTNFRHNSKVGKHYRNATELYLEMVSLQKQYPEQVYLYSIGDSVQGRRLWVIAVSEFAANRHVSGRPEVKLVANIHGDETVGRELLLNLVAHLLRSGDPDAATLLRSARLHFLVSMNPDGFAASVEGNCFSGTHGRGNAHDKDLNRNFPDEQMGLNLKHDHLEPETRAVMRWLRQNTFVLSGSLHGGALVANYPFDSYRGDSMISSDYFKFAKHPGRKNMERSSEDLTVDGLLQWKDYAAAPDDDVFVHLARTYADVHPDIKLGCAEKSDGIQWDRFPDGITNGYAWYTVSGGMQDYNYLYAGCLELTLEVSCCKFPPGHQLPQFWMKNEQSLMQYLLQINRGIRGFIHDSKGRPVKAKLYIKGRKEAPFHSTHLGEYWRVLLPGSYELVIEHRKNNVISVPIVVPPNSGYAVYNLTILLHRKGHHRVSHYFPNVSHYLYSLPAYADPVQISTTSSLSTVYDGQSRNSDDLKASSSFAISSRRTKSLAIMSTAYIVPAFCLVSIHIHKLL